MPKFDNLTESVNFFFHSHFPTLKPELETLPGALQRAIEEMPEITAEMNFNGNSIFLLPDLTLSDLIFVFCPSEYKNCSELTCYKSNNVFFLTAALKKSADLEALLNENKNKHDSIPKLREVMAQTEARGMNPFDRNRCLDIHLLINIIKKVKVDLNLRDPNGRHIAQYAALAGNYDTLNYLLSDHHCLAGITFVDQKAIMACAVASKSEECVKLIAGTFNLKPMGAINPMPVRNFSSMNDADLYAFIKEFAHWKISNNDNQISVVAYYYETGVQFGPCLEMIERLRKLELNPMMLERNYDIDLVIRTQNEFMKIYIETFSFLPARFQSLVSSQPILITLTYAIDNNDIGTIHSLLHRNPELLDDRIRIVESVVAKNKPDILKYLMKFKRIDIHFLTGKKLLNVACRSGCLETVRYFIEELGLAENIEDNFKKSAFLWAFEKQNNPVIPYLLNRVNFLTPALVFSSLKLDQFEFSEQGVRNLFAKSNQELGEYLNFMGNLITKPELLAGLNLKLLTVDMRLELLVRLKSFNNASIFNKMIVAVETALLQDQSTHSEKQAKQFSEHITESAQQQANYLKIIVNPFSDEKQRADAYNALKTADGYGYFGVADVFKQAQKYEANRMIQLVENNQGNLLESLDTLEKFANAGIEQAKEFVKQRNDRLAIEMRINAQTKNDKRSEAKLRDFAKTHPYAQVQLAVLLIERYRVATKSWNPLAYLGNQNMAKEAFDLLNSSAVSHFPETIYWRGVCAFEGIAGVVAKNKGLDFYFHAAKNGCALAAETLKSLDKVKDDADRSELRCRAAIYNAILAYDPGRHYCKFEELANKYQSLFFPSIADILQSQSPQYNPIQFLQIALKYVKTTEQRKLIESAFTSIFKKYHSYELRTEKEFVEMLTNLDPILCTKYALVFLNNTQILPGIKRVWVVAAEMKWVAAFGDKPCVELNNLQNCLKDEAAHDISQIKELFKMPESNLVATPVITLPTAPELTLRERLEIADPFAIVPDHLQDPIHHEIMTDPGSADDGRIYDRCTFNLFKDKKSPIKDWIILKTFTPLDGIRTDAIEFVQAAERRKNEKPATSSATSSTSISAATNSGVTFYEKPTVPIAEKVEQKPAELPSTPINEVDVAVLQVATDDLVVPQAAPPGQMELA